VEATRLSAAMTLPYRLEVFAERDEDGDLFYVAHHPELRGCLAQGRTPEEAVASLREARELYLQSLIEDGLEVPLPRLGHEQVAAATSHT
jgi:antitoxin HicB